jgi:hypothetical protein
MHFLLEKGHRRAIIGAHNPPETPIPAKIPIRLFFLVREVA